MSFNELVVSIYISIYNNSTCFFGEFAYIRHIGKANVCHIFIYLYQGIFQRLPKNIELYPYLLKR